MKEALYSALVVVGYSTGLLGFLYITNKTSLITALNYNLLGGVIVFLVLSIANSDKKR